VNLYPYQEELYVQGFTALIMLLLTPIHRKLAPIYSSAPENQSSFLNTLYGLARLLFITLLLVFSATYWATFGLPPAQNQPVLTYLSFGIVDIPVSLPMTGAFVAGIAIALLVYFPPGFREITIARYFRVLRALLAVACVIVLVLMYQTFVDPTGFLKATIAASGAVLLAAPVQRVLS
jgi:hypothetical protein